MVVKEFEGKNEKEAIDRAIEELGLDRNEIDFEIVEAKRPGILFRGGKVKIRVHMSEELDGQEDEEPVGTARPLRRVSSRRRSPSSPAGFSPAWGPRQDHRELPRGQAAGPGYRE